MPRRSPPPAPVRLASPPCLAGEVAPDYFDPLGVDPQQALDVARWRKAERERLLAARAGLNLTRRADLAAALSDQLRAALPDVAGRVIGGYWPIKGELDLRPLLRGWAAAGARLVLPVVERRAAPLVFREWRPGARMERGIWNIPVPPADAPQLAPDVVLAPLVGWDGAGFRLGYGGGYFDRTLASLAPCPMAIGVGVEAARLATIFPQPHDIALNLIVTEQAIHQPQRG